MPGNGTENSPVRRGGDPWLGAALLATAGAVLIFSRSIQAIGLGDNFDPGPRTFPIGLSLILVIGGLIELWKSRATEAVQSTASEHEDTAPIDPASKRQVVYLLCGFLLYVILLPWLGFAFSTMLIGNSLMILLGNSWRQSLIVSVILISAVFLLFVILFKVPLPGGIFNLPF